MSRRKLAVLVLAFGIGAVVGTVATPAAAASFHCNQVNLHPNNLNSGNFNIPYLQHVWYTPSNPYFCYWNVTGLPTGLTFVPGPQPWEGDIVGTPGQIGVFTVTVGDGCTFVLGTICRLSNTYSLTINP